MNKYKFRQNNKKHETSFRKFFLFSFLSKMMDQRFFHFILDKVLNTTVVTASLIIYSKRDKTLIFLSVLIGFITNVMIYTTGIKLNNQVQSIISLLIALLSTRIGFNILKKRRHDVISRFILLLLPACFMITQGLDVSHKSHTFIMTVSSIVLCSLFGLAYYSAVTYFSSHVQTCCSSIVIYLTGAIAVSKLFGCLEQMINPPLKNLVLIIREQSTSSLVR